MTATGWFAVAVAGFCAGVVNAVAGGGSLLTFPVLVGLGVPPVVANVSNTLGLVPGSLASAWGYRRELGGQWPRIRHLAPWSIVGAILGGVLLLRLPAAAFATVVPVLLVFSIFLMGFQERIVARLAGRAPGTRRTHARLPALGVGLAGVYGGYFGAAQGVLLLGVLGATVSAGIQQLTGLKNVLATLVNAVAAVTFVAIAQDLIAGPVAAVIAGSSICGGLAGASVGRRLSPRTCRIVVMVLAVFGTVLIVLG